VVFCEEEFNREEVDNIFSRGRVVSYPQKDDEFIMISGVWVG